MLTTTGNLLCDFGVLLELDVVVGLILLQQQTHGDVFMIYVHVLDTLWCIASKMCAVTVQRNTMHLYTHTHTCIYTQTYT